MSVTTHAPKQIDPSASLHAESLGLAKSHGRLAGRRIIVVGAGQRNVIDENPPIGNGRAMSVLFAREGASVACIDVSKEAADDTVGQITAEGGKAFTDVVDVSDVSAIAPSVERCAKKLGGLDGLALNVGISCSLPLPKMTAEAWDRDYAVNVRSHMLFAQKALETISPGGAIILTSSMASQRANGRNPAYEFLQGRADRAGAGDRPGRRGKGRSLQCDRAGIYRYPDGPRCQPAARRPRGDSAIRPSGHRLGGRLCCVVPDFE